MDKPIVSLITPCYNRLEYTMKCVDTFRRYNPDFNFEHIAIDNASEDGTKEWFKYVSNQGDWWKHIVYYRNKENLGDHEAKIQGLQMARGDYLMTTDSDTYITEPDFFKKFIIILDFLHEQYDVVGIFPLRLGVVTRIKIAKPVKIEFDFGEITCGGVPFGPIVFYKREYMPFLPHTGKPEHVLGNKIWKVWSIALYDADKGTMLPDHQYGNQMHKYPKYFETKKIPKGCIALERKTS